MPTEPGTLDSRIGPSSEGHVTEAALERQLAQVREEAAGAVEGVFGPRSSIWRIDREAALFLGAGRALLLQLAHPWVAAAVAEHSSALADPIGRFHRTFGIMFAMVFGTLDQALAASHRLHRRHSSITGTLPTAVGPWKAGAAYQAHDIAALRWVHSTLIDTSLLVYDLVLPPLGAEDRERYYDESKRLAALFGIPRDALPPSWDDFTAYCQAMWRSDTLTVSPAARRVAAALLSGTPPWLRPPYWYLTLTGQLLPTRLREAFALPDGPAAARSAERAIGRIRHLYPALPDRLRCVGPYHEAMARLAGSPRPGLTTQVLNRLWIGRPFIAD
jgi:uncharacterized protein (DUF2236 family)